MADPIFFADASLFGAWLERNHGAASELIVGFWKKGSGRPSMTWAESVEQALRYGWIDGVRRSLGEEAYTIRFTPRRKGSIWSAKNLATMQRLLDEGQVAPAGRAIYEARDLDKTSRYSFERADAALDAGQERQFRRNRKAWAFFQSQPPSYRRPAIWWVVSAKKPATQARRLAQLIADSEAELRIALLRR